MAGDVAFAPDIDAARHRLIPRSRLQVEVTDLPPVLGWSEVVGILRRWDDSGDLDRALAQALVGVAGVEGARRVGVDVTSLEAVVASVVSRVSAW